MKFKPDTKGAYVPVPEGYYIKLPHMKATLVAVQALIEDGASFHVKSSGPTGSITIYDTRSWSIVEQVNNYYRLVGKEPTFLDNR